MQEKLAYIIGTGPIGRHTARELITRGWEVAFLSRTVRGGLPSGKHPGGQSSKPVDARDAAALTAATQGAQLIVHAANVPYQFWERDLFPLQDAAISAAHEQGAVLACTDNLYSYDPSAQPFSEKSARNPPTRKGRLRLRLLEARLEAHAKGWARNVSVQGSDYFGPEADWQSYFGSRFLGPLLAGKTPSLYGNLERLHSFTYLPDFGRALAIAGTEASALGRVWIAPTPKALGIGETAGFFLEAAGRKGTRIGRLGRGAIALAGLFNPLIRELKEMLYEFEEDFVTDSGDFERSFGLAPTETTRAVQETVAWFKSRLG